MNTESTQTRTYPDSVGRPMLCQDRPHDTTEREPARRRTPCRGRVDFREPLSGTGVPTIRCEGHWADRLELQARVNRNYPDSPTPPRWYREQGGYAYAGEHWDEPD